MKRRTGENRLLPAAAFLLLGACLLLSANGMLSDAHVRRERAELPDGRAALWTYAGERHLAEMTDREDGHDHTVTVSASGAALVLTSAFDGSRSLAAELVRRGVTVLLYSGDDGVGAWRYLGELCGKKTATALLAGPDRAEEALSLAGELWESGERPGAVILLGNEAAVRAAADYPGGNILILTRSKPDMEARTAFYGSGSAAERGFEGFYGEGTARACAWDRDFGSFARRETLIRVADWKGSTLGHAVEIPDGDQIFHRVIFSYTGAAACLLLAGGTLAARFRRKRQE